jgi:hypothetical protein
VYEKTTCPNVGQDNIDPSIAPKVKLGGLQALRKHLDRFLSRLSLLCGRLRARIAPERDTDAEPSVDAKRALPRVPSIAVTYDGRMLLSVHCVEGIDIADRETWTGVFLIGNERSRALDAIANGADDAAAHVGGKLIAKAKRKKPEESGGDGQG